MLSNPAFVALFAVLAVGQGPEDRKAGPPGAKKPAPEAEPLVLSPTINKAITAYEELDYRKSQQFLRKALERSLQDRQRAVALAYLGRIRAIRGGHDKAIRTFMRVLALDETYEITWQESPRIQDAWRAATARYETQKQQPGGAGETTAVSPDGDVPEQAPPNSDLELPPSLVDNPVETESPADSAPGAEPPRNHEPAPELDLTEVPPASHSNRWKYWAAGAAVVVAAAVVTVLVITLPDDGPNRRGAIPWQLP